MQKVNYACDYAPKDADAVSRALSLLVGTWRPDSIQMEWVPDNAQYEEGVSEAPPAIGSQLESGLIRLGWPREAADEEWLINFAPWSFSAEFYDQYRRIVIDVADASSLVVELRDDARVHAPQVLAMFESVGLKVGKI